MHLNYRWFLLIGLLVGSVVGIFVGGTLLRTVFAGNTPPVARFSFGPNNASPGRTISFDGSASTDPDGSITSYAWSFGDGSTATGSSATHAYSKSGSFIVKLTVADNGGAANTETAEITVLSSIILNSTLVLDPGNGTGLTVIGENLSPQQPVNVTMVMLSGNFTAGVDFTILGPCSAGQCPAMSDHVLNQVQTRVSFILNGSTAGFSSGFYQLEIFDQSSTTVATVALEISRV